MKRTAQTTILTFGALIILGFSAGNIAAQECYGPDAMYGEGPVENCQQRAGKVIVSEHRTAMLEEGVAIPGQKIEKFFINPTLAKNARQMSGDVFSEGIVVGVTPEIDMISLRENALRTEPAAGQ